MQSLKIEPEPPEPADVADDAYGYGTRICLEDGQIDAIGASGYKVGDRVRITGFANVTSTSIREDADDKGGKSRRMELQLTDAESSPASSEAGAAERMYGQQA